MNQMEQRRNAPCWCGSGLKYKKCHMADDLRSGRVAPEPPTPAPARRLRRRPAPILTQAQQDKMRVAGRFNAQLMDFIRPHVREGISTGEIDNLVHQYTLDHGHVPACLHYKGFPKSCCTSINEVVCHGIPGRYLLRSGDIINVDLTTIVDGWYGDQSETFLIGDVSQSTRKLVQVAFDCLYLGIRAIEPGDSVMEIGIAIAEHAEARGFSVVRECQGHGLGQQFHQPPDVPHYPEPRVRHQTIEPGMCFTIEPMINAGVWQTTLDQHDGWTIRTADNKLSAQFEHTILMTANGPEILTTTDNGPKEGYTFLVGA